MTIDERLEALTQSVELLAGMNKDAELRAREAEQRTREAEQRADKRMEKLEGYMVAMMQSIARLSNVTAVHTIQVDDHERRIAELERPQ